MIQGRVNVIVPLYNQEAYIAHCLESVFAQTYRNFDITVINDGSTDLSRTIVQDVINYWNISDRVKFLGRKVSTEPEDSDKLEILPDPYYKGDPVDPGYLKLQKDPAYRRLLKCPEFLKRLMSLENAEELMDMADPEWLGGSSYRGVPGYWFLNGLWNVIDQENQGLSKSRNRGIRERDGEFILPLDSDDWIDPTYLEQTVPKMADPKVGIVSTDMQYEGLRHARIPPRGLTLKHEMVNNDLPVCSLIRRTAFAQTDGYATIFAELDGGGKAQGYEDWCMWIDLLKRGWQVATVNEPLFHYRVRGNSMVVEAEKVRSGLVRVIHLLHPDLWPKS